MKTLKHSITAIRNCLKTASPDRASVLKKWLKEDKQNLKQKEELLVMEKIMKG